MTRRPEGASRDAGGLSRCIVSRARGSPEVCSLCKQQKQSSRGKETIMHNVRRLLIATTMVAATIVGASAAHADRKMLVLIDATGSMSIQRADLQTRFEAARQRAVDQIGVQAGLGLAGVAVYTFSDNTSTLQTVGGVNGFVSVNAAITKIAGDPNAVPPIPPLDLFTVGGGITPLAGSMCKAVDDLMATGATTKILEVASDGEQIERRDRRHGVRVTVGGGITPLAGSMC